MTMLKNSSLWHFEALLQEALTTCPNQALIDSHVSRKLRHYATVFELASSGPLYLPLFVIESYYFSH